MDANPAQVPWALRNVIRRGPETVLSLRVLEMTASFIRRVTPVKGLKLSRTLAALGVASAPTLVNTLLTPTGAACTDESLFWLIYYVPLVYLLLLLPRAGWSALIPLSRNLALAVDSPQPLLSAAKTLKNAQDSPAQSRLSWICAAAGPLTLALVAQQLSPRIVLCPASYFSVGLTAFLGVNAFYWLLTGSLLLRKIMDSGQLKLYWHAPLATPVLREGSRLLSSVAIGVAIGLALFEIPLLVVTYRLQLPRELLIVNIGALAGSLTAVFAVAGLPQVWISRAASRSKWRQLDRIARQIQAASGGTTSDVRELLTLFHELEKVPTRTLEARVLLNYVSAFLATLAPQALQLFSHLLERRL